MIGFSLRPFVILNWWSKWIPKNPPADPKSCSYGTNRNDLSLAPSLLKEPRVHSALREQVVLTETQKVDPSATKQIPVLASGNIANLSF